MWTHTWLNKAVCLCILNTSCLLLRKFWTSDEQKYMLWRNHRLSIYFTHHLYNISHKTNTHIFLVSCDLHVNVRKSVQLVQSHGTVMTWDFPRINANVLKSIRPWQLRDIRRNLRVRAHQCAGTVLSTKDSVSHRASGHPWQNLDYDSVTARAGEVNADDYNIPAKLIFHLLPTEREHMWGDYQQERASFSTKACWHASWIWTGFVSEAHSSAG